MVDKIRLSISSKPLSSTLRAFKENSAIDKSIFPFPFICAKSRVLRNKAFAIRGVPRLRPAISIAALSSIGVSKIREERSTIELKSSTL